MGVNVIVRGFKAMGLVIIIFGKETGLGPEALGSPPSTAQEEEEQKPAKE